jgi:hypothetical protein
MFQSSSYPVPSARTAFVMRTSQLAASQVSRDTSYPPVTGDVLHDWSDEHALAIIKAAANAIRRHGANEHRLLIVCVTSFPHCVFVTFCGGTAPSSTAAHLSAHSVRAGATSTVVISASICFNARCCTGSADADMLMLSSFGTSAGNAVLDVFWCHFFLYLGGLIHCAPGERTRGGLNSLLNDAGDRDLCHVTCVV